MENYVDSHALSLRRMLARSAARVIAVTGGSGGMGRTAALVNLAVALTEQNLDVLVVDECPGDRSASAVLRSAPAAGTSGSMPPRKMPPVLAVDRRTSPFATLGVGYANHGNDAARLWDPVLERSPEIVLIDAALHRNGELSPLALEAHDVIVVTRMCSEAVANAYVCMKRIRAAQGIAEFRVLMNRVDSEADADSMFQRLADIARDYLAVSAVKAGCIAADPCMAAAAELSRCVVDAFPSSPAARDFRRFAAEVASWATRPIMPWREATKRRAIALASVRHRMAGLMQEAGAARMNDLLTV